MSLLVMTRKAIGWALITLFLLPFAIILAIPVIPLVTAFAIYKALVEGEDDRLKEAKE